MDFYQLKAKSITIPNSRTESAVIYEDNNLRIYNINDFKISIIDFIPKLNDYVECNFS